MIIQRVHQLIKLKFNELDSNRKVDLPPALLDDLINSVIHDYVEIFYSGKSLNKYGFEVTQQRIDMLSTLVESEDVSPGTATDGIYKIDFSKLKKPYMHLIGASAITDCGLVNIKRVQHEALNTTLNDALIGPSKNWKRAIGVQRSSSDGESTTLNVYTNDLFKVENVTIEYIRCPRKVFFGGYDTLEYLENKTSYKSGDKPVSPDTPEKYHYMLVDMAVQELSRIFGMDTNPQTEKILSKI